MFIGNYEAMIPILSEFRSLILFSVVFIHFRSLILFSVVFIHLSTAFAR